MDKTINKLKDKIGSMLDGLETKTSKVEELIGDKLNLLDKDRDGVLSADELIEVLNHVMKNKLSAADVADIVDQLDTDHDGYFTVDELMDWIEMNKFTRAVEEDRDVVTKAAAQDDDEDDDEDDEGFMDMETKLKIDNLKKTKAEAEAKLAFDAAVELAASLKAADEAAAAEKKKD